MLPIIPHLPEIYQSLTSGCTVILQAQPGAGKTSEVPLYLSRKFPKKTYVVEPRRLACKVMADFLARRCQETVGTQIGYHLRNDKKISRQSQLIFLTEGMLLNYLSRDPLLESASCVIVDEFHERSLGSDLSLAILRTIKQRRPDFHLVVMSATMDAAKLNNYLDNSKIFSISGRSFPVTCEFLDPQKFKSPQKLELCLAAWRHLSHLFSDSSERAGACLVFLASKKEIHSLQESLQSALPSWNVLVLYADLPAVKQQMAFKEDCKPRMILTTNVAETSLTIPGVKAVIDFGDHFISGFGHWNGLSHIRRKKISQASAKQRTGRAGREQPGHCVRVYSEADYLSRPAYEVAELQRSELSQTMLQLLAILHRLLPKNPVKFDEAFSHLQFFQPPRLESINEARGTLFNLEAIDKEGFLTDFGLLMAKLPLHPRLSAMILVAQKHSLSAQTLLATCLLQVGSILAPDAPQQKEVASCDIIWQLRILQGYLGKNSHPSTWHKQCFLLNRTQEIWRLFRQYCQDFKHILNTEQWQLSLEVMQTEDWLPQNENAWKAILMSGYKDRVGRVLPKAKVLLKRKEDKRGRNQTLGFNLCQGKGASLSLQSVASRSEYLIALDAVERDFKQRAGLTSQITLASGLSETELLSFGSGMIAEKTVVMFHKRSGQAEKKRRRFYGNILIDEQAQTLSFDESQAAFREKVQSEFPHGFKDPQALNVYHRKRQLLQEFGIDHNLPEFVDELWEILMHEHCQGVSDLNELSLQSLAKTIADQLTDADKDLLAKTLPDLFKLPNGRRLTIDYDSDSSPGIASRLQDFYSCREHPSLLQGRLPLKVILLAPSGRPIQVTQDLLRFWQGSYRSIWVEMKSRYPKHTWLSPEDIHLGKF